MQDYQKQFKQTAQAEMEQFRRQVQLLEQRHQAFLRQMAFERRVADLDRLLAVVNPSNPSPLGRLYSGLAWVRALLGRQDQDEAMLAQPPADVDVLYTVSATGVIEQTEPNAEEGSSHDRIDEARK